MTGTRLAEIRRRLAAGDAHGARSLADELLQASTVPDAQRAAALSLRARAHEALNDPAAAMADLDAATALAPGDAGIWNELGVVCAIAHHHERAAAAFQRAVTTDPRNPRAWNNLGNSLRASGQLRAAASAFEQAVEIRPDYALALANLGSARRDLGDPAAAETVLQRALAADPKLGVALLALGSLCRHQGRLDDAIALFARGAQAAPKDAHPCIELAYTLAERDDVTMARRVYAEAQTRDPSSIRAQLGARLTLPMVAESTAALAAARADFDQGLSALAHTLPALVRSQDATAVLDGLRWSNFLLAYQGGDDRALQARYATLVGAAIAAVALAWRGPLPAHNPRERRVRVGFVSSFFRDGTVGRYFEH